MQQMFDGTNIDQIYAAPGKPVAKGEHGTQTPTTQVAAKPKIDTKAVDSILDEIK